MPDTLLSNLHHLAEHLSDAHDGLPLHAKNTVLLAAKVVEALPVTADGVRVVPNVDPIWINPNEPHWIGQDVSYGTWDDEDNFTPSPPVIIKKWAHYGDQLCVLVDGEVEMRHWEGPFYSTRDAASTPTPTKGE